MTELFEVFRMSFGNAMIGTVGATVAFMLAELIRRYA